MTHNFGQQGKAYTLNTGGLPHLPFPQQAAQQCAFTLAGQATDAAAGCLSRPSCSGGAAADVQPDLAAGRATDCAQQPRRRLSCRALLDIELKRHKVIHMHSSGVVAYIVNM